METLVNDQYSELEQSELLKNKDSVQLYLEYGKKMGLFDTAKNTDRVYRFLPAQYCLAYLIDQLMQNGLDQAKRTLDQYTENLTVTGDNDPDFTSLKRTIIDLQRKNFTSGLQSAIASKNKEDENNFRFELDKLKISESDLLEGRKIDRFSFDAISPDLLPTWFVLVREKKFLPAEIAEMINADGNIVAETSAQPEIKSQLVSSHNQALRAIKTSKD